ncbi:MAG TPA: vitamin K epoxide reductase family protein [Candidatus Omnitrophota bacterium]|nr:vitamin K epoxide reductase family protein [Candidatus Omnitrophota bacterium]
MSHKLRYSIILIIMLFSLVSSILLSFVPLSLLCTPLEGCNAVQNSSYAQTFGIHNSYFGIAIFALMSFVTFMHIMKPNKSRASFIKIGIFTGTLISLYFIFLQQFVIHAYCKYCLIIDIGMLVALIIMLIPQKKRNIDTKF